MVTHTVTVIVVLSTLVSVTVTSVAVTTLAPAVTQAVFVVDKYCVRVKVAFMQAVVAASAPLRESKEL